MHGKVPTSMCTRWELNPRNWFIIVGTRITYQATGDAGGAATGYKTNKGEIRKNWKKEGKKDNHRLAIHQARPDFFHIITITTEGKKKGNQTQQSRIRVNSCTRTCRHESPRQVLPTSRRGTLRPCLLSPFCFQQPTAVSLRLLPPSQPLFGTPR